MKTVYLKAKRSSTGELESQNHAVWLAKFPLKTLSNFMDMAEKKVTYCGEVQVWDNSLPESVKIMCLECILVLNLLYVFHF